MLRALLIFITLSTLLSANTSVHALKYESGISIYGKIGTVALTLEENYDLNTYKMIAKTTSTGMVKFLSGNRIDTFTSEGKIKNGVYQPLKFIRHTSKNDSTKIRTYTFDYAAKTVTKEELNTQIESAPSFDSISLDFIEEEEYTVQTKEVKTIDFETNDFLSLYLNLIKGNLNTGEVPYIDMKDKDTLLYVKNNLFEVHKNHGEDKYSVVMIPDTKSIFFEEVISVGIAFYGDAYIKKTSESMRTINH